MVCSRYMLAVGMLLVFGILGGCGKSIDSTSQNTQDGVPVQGVGGFGSQCAFGTIGDPKPLSLIAYNCGAVTTTSKFELAAPLLPIILQADCKKLEVTARTIDGNRIESRWKALPDGRFYFMMDAGNASLGNAGAGMSNCQTPSTLEVAGLMKCADRDHAEVQVDATWHLGQTMPGTSPHLTGGECSVPNGCILHGFTILNQCG
jgi:hypothetical protein